MPEEAPVAEAKPKRRLPKTAIIVAVVAVVEAGVLIGAMKFMGGSSEPKEAFGGEHGHYAEPPAAESQPTARVEVALLEKFRVPNNKTGRTYLYDFDVVVSVDAAHKERVEKLKTERAGEISDRVAQIVRGADSQVLNEVDFKTLRMQIENAFGAIAGDKELIHQVLIPRCVPIRVE